jgi:hybrid polyketide synthase/nonribosomal peptide synthetase ACE1
MLSQHLDYLRGTDHVKLSDVVYTLQRRSTLPYRKSVPATNVSQAIEALSSIVSSLTHAEEANNITTRFSSISGSPRILGIFTGQGAQWARMGAELIDSSPFVASRIATLDASLQNLPLEQDRPAWSLKEELRACKDTSRIKEAALSQPLCTAVQIVLVDILHAAGICFTAVVGHSSGEISAAYAAGFISAKDAIRIAYFRGVHAKLASSPNPNVGRGAMIAVGHRPVKQKSSVTKIFQEGSRSQLSTPALVSL